MNDSTRVHPYELPLGALVAAGLATAAALLLPTDYFWPLAANEAGARIPTLVALIGAIVIGGGVIVTAIGVARDDDRDVSRATMTGLLAVWAVGVFCLVAVVAHSAIRRVADAPIIWLVLVIGAVLALGAAAHALNQVRLLAKSSSSPRLPVAPVELAASEHAVHTGTTRSSHLIIFAFAIGAIAAAVGVYARDIEALLDGGIPVLAALIFAQVRSRADRTGLHLGLWFLPWPRVHIPIAEIETVEVADVHAAAWGGYGYRGNLKLLKRAALVLRPGKGVVLTLSGDRTFAATIDHPEQVAAVLAAYAAQQRPAPAAG